MLANWITLSRFPLLLVTILIIFRGAPTLKLIGVGLLFIGLLLDTVDGVVARRTGRTTLLGSVLDIAADRAYELVLWVSFAALGTIPMVIPLAVVVRTALTDAFRSIGVGQGTAPFAQHGTALGRFLVGSTAMRSGYALAKTTTFCGLALADAVAALGAPAVAVRLSSLFAGTAWVALALCLLRGLPVIGHGVRHHWRPPAAVGPNR